MPRDRRFIAEHRGGLLPMTQHRLMMQWACACAERVVPLFGTSLDDRLIQALVVARRWAVGEAKVGEAMKASIAAHAAARDAANPVSAAVARAIAHAVATAHMADHSIGGALYSLRALKAAGRPLARERAWQIRHAPIEVKDLILKKMPAKAAAQKL